LTSNTTRTGGKPEEKIWSRKKKESFCIRLPSFKNNLTEKKQIVTVVTDGQLATISAQQIYILTKSIPC